MKKILTLLIICISVHGFGQSKNDYIAYYNLTNEGDRQIYLKNDSLAYNFYLQAFEQVDFVHSEKLMTAARLSVKQ